MPNFFGMYGGDDGARTRDLCRDRAKRYRNSLKLKRTGGSESAQNDSKTPLSTQIKPTPRRKQRSGGMRPASQYQSSPRTYPDRVPEPKYGSNMKPKRVYPDGTFFWKAYRFSSARLLAENPSAWNPSTIATETFILQPSLWRDSIVISSSCNRMPAKEE
jgi:hypothetical protein